MATAIPWYLLFSWLCGASLALRGELQPSATVCFVSGSARTYKEVKGTSAVPHRPPAPPVHSRRQDGKQPHVLDPIPDREGSHTGLRPIFR